MSSKNSESMQIKQTKNNESQVSFLTNVLRVIKYRS